MTSMTNMGMDHKGVITGPVTVGATPGDPDPTLLPSTTGATEVTNQLVRSYPSNRPFINNSTRTTRKWNVVCPSSNSHSTKSASCQMGVGATNSFTPCTPVPICCKQLSTAFHSSHIRRPSSSSLLQHPLRRPPRLQSSVLPQ